jgi:hypothetical protein
MRNTSLVEELNTESAYWELKLYSSESKDGLHR